MPLKRSQIKSPFLTPEMMRLAREEQLARAMTELFKLHRDFLAKIDVVANYVLEVRNEAARIKNLPKGDKGDKGDVGPRGVPGRNGATVEEVLARVPTLKDGVTPDVQAIAG